MEAARSEPPFHESDDDAFVRAVTDYVRDGAPQLRGTSVEAYVDRCRELWEECETDQVFRVKRLMDKLVLDRKERETWPPPGFKDVSTPSEAIDDLYVEALGLVLPDGSFVDAPDNYDPRPTNPKSRRVLALAIPQQIPVEEPDDAKPGDYLLALFDVLGFSNKLREIGLERMQKLYASLIDIALKPHVAENQWTKTLTGWGDGRYSPGLFWLPIRYAYFSDSILLWIPYQAEFVEAFLDRTLNMFCEALRLELPLRGAVAAGVAILHKKSNTFLGEPLVEAARVHDAQQWVGTSFGASIKSQSSPIPFSPYQVMLYDAPVKDKGRADLLSGIVLDWPRRWRELQGSSARQAVQSMRSDGFEVYYDTAIAFIDSSDRDPEWFLRVNTGSHR